MIGSKRKSEIHVKNFAESEFRIYTETREFFSHTLFEVELDTGDSQ